MIRNFFVTAFRFFTRYRLFTFINVLGLAVSIALFILIGLYVKTVLQTDRFHENADRIYRLERPQIHNIPGPFGPFILEHFPEVENCVRMCEGTVSGRLLGYEQKHIKLEHIWLADRSFFEIFSFSLTASSGGVFEAPDRIVLSRSTAEKLFGTENPVGKQIMMDNRYSLQVDGVMEDPPANSSIKADAVISMQYITTIFNDPHWLESFVRWNYNMLLLLKPGADPEALVDKINRGLYDFLSRNMNIPVEEKPEFILTRLDQIYFNSYVSYDGFQHGNRAHVYVAMGIALIILLLAVVNFVNLSTAQSTERTLDIGLRKTLGASGRRLMIQHLAESVLITCLSTLLALALVSMTLPFFSSLVRMDLSLWPVRPWVMAVLVTGPVLLGVLAGLYPAFYLRRFPPLRIMSTGETPGYGGALFRKALIMGQFTAAITLIIFTLHVEKQVRYMNSRDLGFSRENKFVLETSPALKENRSAFLHELYNHPGVVAASFHGYPVGRIDEKWSMKNGAVDVSFRVQLADSAYLRAMGLTLVEGRNFRNHEPADSAYEVILNRKAVEMFSLEEPVGLASTFFNNNRFRVVGVVDDFHFESLHKPVEPLAIINRAGTSYVTVRCRDHAENEVRGFLEDLWHKYSPGYPMICQSMDMRLRKLYSDEGRLKNIASGFSAFSLFIACIGMFGLSLFHIGKRIREVGIRKTMGASSAGIIRLFTWQFGKLVAFSALLAFPLSYWVISRWMQNFITPAGQSWVLYAVAGGISVVVALLTVMVRSVQAAGTNPAEVLRYE